MINMLISSIFDFDVVESFYQLCLAIDSVIYSVFGWLYSVFMSIAGARIFSEGIIQDFTSRIYTVISIVMLFIVAYTFLVIIINPDNLNKGDMSALKLVKNILLSLLCIIFIPTVFNYAYAVQRTVVEEGIITNLVLGDKSDDVPASDAVAGDFVTAVFESSYYLVSNEVGEVTSDAYDAYQTADSEARQSGDIGKFSDTINYVKSGEIKYNFFLSAIIGGFVLYTLFIFSIDLGLRSIKLAFYQLMAPIPSLLLIVPGQSKVFSSWIKEVLKTFFEVFVKIIIMSFGVYFITVIDKAFDEGTVVGFSTTSPYVMNFAKLFIILGIVLFMKQLPKLLGDVFGIKMDGHGLSLKKRVDDIKDSFAPIFAPIDRVAGAAMGLHFANKARNKAIENGADSSGWKTAVSRFNGLRNGFRGGIRNAGSAYRYEQLMQQSYALDSTKSAFEQFTGAMGDRLRDNVGRDSRYDEEVLNQAIVRDRKAAEAKEDLRRIREATGTEIKNIEKEHYDTISANTSVLDKSKAFMDAVSDDTSKADSNMTISNLEIIDARAKKLESDKLDAISDGNTQLAQRLEVEQKQLEKLKASGLLDMNSKLNNFGMDAEIERIRDLAYVDVNGKRITLDDDMKSAMRSMYSFGKKMVDQRYVADRQNWSSGVKMKFDDLQTVINGDRDAGFIVKNHTKISKADKEYVDFQSMLSSADTIVKIKKKASELVDLENMEKNKQLTSGPVSVRLIADERKGPSATTSKTLYEWSQDDKRLDEQIKDLNKEYEKIYESMQAAKEAAEVRKKARDIYKHKAGK